MLPLPAQHSRSPNLLNKRRCGRRRFFAKRCLFELSSTGAIVGAAAADPIASAVAGVSAEVARTGIGARANNPDLISCLLAR
jgi:hypothetical protein